MTNSTCKDYTLSKLLDQWVSCANLPTLTLFLCKLHRVIFDTKDLSDDDDDNACKRRSLH